jgi:molybdopterin-binding protein
MIRYGAAALRRKLKASARDDGPACFNQKPDRRGIAARIQPSRGAIMRLSARNQIKGTVLEVKKGATTSHVRVDIGGTVMTSSITNEAVDDLGIKVGGKVIVVVKASDVMIAVE